MPVDMMEDKMAKAANKQAWRKKPRKFAPKSRLGCKTCKIRRVKCDFARPSCSRCLSTGRTCDGYTEKAEISQPKRPYKVIALKADKSNHPRLCTISVDESERWHSQHHKINLPILGSFMILPMTGLVDAESMFFFQNVSIKHLNGYRPCESWRKALMTFAQTVPPVRHAAIALATIHRNYLDNPATPLTQQMSLSKDQPVNEAPLYHYNRAIQLLLELEGGDSAEITAITLLVCYLFTCFDHLAGDDAQAFKHLRGGLALSQSTNFVTFNNYAHEHVQSSDVHEIIHLATHQIRRLDMQAGVFLVDWSPADIEDTFTTQLALFHDTFQSLDQAADHLQILLTQVMKLRSTEQQLSPTGTMPPLPSSLTDLALNNLESWSSHFENYLQQHIISDLALETKSLVSLLRLQHTVAWIILCGGGTGDEMNYDNFLLQFQQSIALATELAAAHEQYSGSKVLTFTPEIGLIPILYIIGAKCRHPIVRREALRILQGQPIREASWDSMSTAKVLARVIEIEEGLASNGQTLQGIQQIPAWQRIEALSFSKDTRRGVSADNLDITYKFCARDSIYTESLAIQK